MARIVDLPSVIEDLSPEDWIIAGLVIVFSYLFYYLGAYPAIMGAYERAFLIPINGTYISEHDIFIKHPVTMAFGQPGEVHINTKNRSNTDLEETLVVDAFLWSKPIGEYSCPTGQEKCKKEEMVRKEGEPDDVEGYPAKVEIKGVETGSAGKAYHDLFLPSNGSHATSFDVTPSISGSMVLDSSKEIYNDFVSYVLVRLYIKQTGGNGQWVKWAYSVNNNPCKGMPAFVTKDLIDINTFLCIKIEPFQSLKHTLIEILLLPPWANGFLGIYSLFMVAIIAGLVWPKPKNDLFKISQPSEQSWHIIVGEEKDKHKTLKRSIRAVILLITSFSLMVGSLHILKYVLIVNSNEFLLYFAVGALFILPVLPLLVVLLIRGAIGIFRSKGAIDFRIEQPFSDLKLRLTDFLTQRGLSRTLKGNPEPGKSAANPVSSTDDQKLFDEVKKKVAAAESNNKDLLVSSVFPWLVNKINKKINAGESGALPESDLRTMRFLLDKIRSLVAMEGNAEKLDAYNKILTKKRAKQEKIQQEIDDLANNSLILRNQSINIILDGLTININTLLLDKDDAKRKEKAGEILQKLEKIKKDFEGLSESNYTKLDEIVEKAKKVIND